MTNYDAPSRMLASRIGDAQRRFSNLLEENISVDGASREQYHRYLTMQFHLTRNVQSYFMSCAGHKDLARRRRFREFLVNFANEEELHYVVAAKDLGNMGLAVGSMPLDVLLWHEFFTDRSRECPFVRLGAAAILENISSGPAKPQIERAMSAGFLRPSNSKFIVLHRHETIPHGEQILAALDAAQLDPEHLDDLDYGARVGTVLYLRMAEWALMPGTLSSLADLPINVGLEDLRRIREVRMDADQTVVLAV